MRFSKFALAAALVLGQPAAADPAADAGPDPASAAEMDSSTAPGAGEEAATGEAVQTPAAAELATDEALRDDRAAESPGSMEAAAVPASQDAATPPEGIKAPLTLGPMGHDAQGQPGRLHEVRGGDTLWDISEAYLGTPWVWPSVWSDNGDIENPHLIRPGDRIWISQGEMRRVTAAEASVLLAGQPGEMPAALAGMDGVPTGDATPPIYRYSEIETTGFVTLGEISGDASIVASPVERDNLAQLDPVVIGLGEGETAVGDQFEILRTGERVFDPDTGRLFGYATERLGWLEVTEVHADSSEAEIRLSRSEIYKGDHLRPRMERERDIEMRSSPSVEGRVVFTPAGHMQIGTSDLVYLDRGTHDGIEVGSPLEVFRPMGSGWDGAKGVQVALPDDVVAKLLVIDVRERTAAAVVTHTVVELARGDRFRGSQDALNR